MSKYQNRYWIEKKAKRGFRGFPVATVAYYGPDDTVATKVAVGIVKEKDAEPILKRWHSEKDVRYDADINKQIVEFIDQYDVKSTAITDGIIGCPHEEGIDYPEGEVCPECPFWTGRDRWTGEYIQ
jgi:hypothetical protein